MNSLRSTLFLLTFAVLTAEAAEPLDPAWIEQIKNQHDLTLPAWGPYSKRYIGISHVPAADKGLRFDLSVFPGLYRRKITLPDVMFENEYHPWEAAPDFSYFSFRHELEWKDQVYADISYSKVDEQSRLVRAECVNRTPLPQSLVLHLIASINFPSLVEYAPNNPIRPAVADLPAGAVWLGALDYKDLRFARPRPQDDLVYDGKRRGELRANDFTNGSGLGGKFGADAGDTAAYEIKLDKKIEDARLLIRYRMKAGERVTLKLEGLASESVDFSGSGGLETKSIKLPLADAGSHPLKLVSAGGAPIEVDGFAIVAARDEDLVKFRTKTWSPAPQIISGPVKNSVILKYPDVDLHYGIAWDFSPAEVREFQCKDLEVFFRTMTHNHINAVLKGEGDGHFTDIFLRPIPLAPDSRRVVYAAVNCGTREDVESRLKATTFDPKACEALWAKTRAQVSPLTPAPQGTAYQFSQQRMAATLLSNVVYPVYTMRSYIKHNTPGRWWDSLYTWDSGFVGLGLAELDVRRALECLNTYLTEPGAQSAFLHHGSMVPVQHYLFLDLWNRTQSRKLLEYCYPRLKQYYEFYLGRLGSSTMRKFGSGILSSFDYFYNSGGWDDYPPQKVTRYENLGPRMAPVVNSAQAIRIAKIMTMAAEALGRKEDIATYEVDIRSLTDSLQKHSWDEQAGYFSYVTHDKDGKPEGIFKTKDGTNFNMGMDGVYPLVAGIGTPAQTAKMLAHLKSPTGLWSRIGLSAVDQSAPYYANDGYWNGTVWMPHQWFFWKTMLDLGEGDFAWQIARTALDLWKTEVDASYNCMEHFVIETGRGAGWHEFGGLSTPVLKWYAAYCRPGTLTTGFDAWVGREEFSKDFSRLDADIKLFGSTDPQKHRTFVACMNPAFAYDVLWNGKSVPVKQLAKGLFNIEIPNGNAPGHLEIRPAAH